jgi:peptide/nickel transport system substrate-binding protein
VDAPAFNPKRAEQLLAEAGYPDGFDAGDFYPFPAQESQGEAMANNLAAVGIRARIRTLECASFIQQWSQKKLSGIVMGTLYPAPFEDVKLTAGQ